MSKMSDLSIKLHNGDKLTKIERAAAITVYKLTQSTGEVLWGACIGGYVVAHGYKTRTAAKRAAEATLDTWSK